MRSFRNEAFVTVYNILISIKEYIKQFMCDDRH